MSRNSDRFSILARTLLAALLLILMAPRTARAGEGEKDLRELVERLERRLEQQAAEIERLRAEQARLRERLDGRTQVAVAAASSTGAMAPQAIGAASRNLTAIPAEPLVASTRGEPPREEKSSWPKSDRLQIGGYGSMRFEANNVGGNEFVPGGAAKSFTFRRFVLTAHAQLTDRIRIHNETEFERLLELELEKRATATAGGLRFAQAVEGNGGAEIGIEQLWLEYDLGRKQAIRAGIILPPLGRFNILHDDDYWDLPRRTLVDRDAPVVPVKVAWRELGVGLVGSANVGASGKLDYQFYVTGGSTIDFNLEQIAQTRQPQRSKQALEAELALGAGAIDGTKNAGGVAWRVAYSPRLAGEIGFSGYHAKYTPSFLPLDERVNAFGLDWKWRLRQFEIEGEAIYSSFGDIARVARSFAATALRSAAETAPNETAALENEIEFELGGLARRRYGFWTDFKYHWRPGFLKKSFLGRGFEDPQLIPILRYEQVWLERNLEELAFADRVPTELEFSNRRQERVTLGINYRPTPQVGVQVAYEHNQRRAGQGLIFPRVLRNATHGFLLGMTFSF